LWGLSCTQAVADAWLQQDIKWAEARVNTDVTVTLTQGEFAACVDFVFNCGTGNFEHSTLLKLNNADDLSDAVKQFEAWNKCDGSVVAGLLRRRAAETAEFRS
jgi:lysozyme